MATEKQIFKRIQATKNIRKITASMKMVSAAKLKGDEGRLAAAKPFNAWTSLITPPAVALEDLNLKDKFPQKNLVIALTSDRGLCGGVNNYVGRYTRRVLAAIKAEGKEVKLVTVGEKGRSSLRRNYAEDIIASYSELEAPITYNTVAKMAADIMTEDVDQIHIIFNEYKSAIAYTTSLKTITPFSKLSAEVLPEYEFEPEEKEQVLRSLGEHAFASNLYYCVIEAATSEQSSRMQAMENASKNAGELIESLTLQYNRVRQARITTELIEIISGASALEG